MVVEDFGASDSAASDHNGLSSDSLDWVSKVLLIGQHTQGEKGLNLTTGECRVWIRLL